MNKIDLSKKQTEAWMYLEDNQTREILYGGGAGGGKTMLGCAWHIFRRTTYPESRGLIARNELKAIKESTLVTLLNVAKALGYRMGIDFKYNANDNVITWWNGSKTLLKELKFYPSDPDFQTLGSTEFTDIFIDEATEITLKAFEIATTRIRYKLEEFNLIPKILLTCNPSPGWVRDRYIKKENKIIKLKPFQRFVPALVTDNPNPKFIKLYEQQLQQLTNDYDKLRLLYGDWDAEPKPINPFCTHYESEKHESLDAVFKPEKRIVFMVDFNINPFSVNLAHIWKDNNGYHFHVFDEISIEAGSIPKLCDYMSLQYGKYRHGWVITGDAMGKNRQINQRNHSSNYNQMRDTLKLSQNQFVLPSNPTHENSRDDVNYFLYHFPDFKINPEKCPNTCRDMKTVQCDAEGSIIKKNRLQLDQRADHLDNIRYGINAFMKKQWIIPHQKMWKGPVEEMKKQLDLKNVDIPPLNIRMA